MHFENNTGGFINSNALKDILNVGVTLVGQLFL